MKHLWFNLKTQRVTEPDGYTLKVRCDWDGLHTQRHLEFGLALANDRLFIRVTDTDLVAGDAIPRLAYLPPFAGITAREMRLSGAMRRRRIGEGLAGAVLRNLLLDMFQANAVERSRLRGGKSKISDTDLKRLRETDPWELLRAVLRTTFSAELAIAPFEDEYHSYIQVEVVKGSVSRNAVKRHAGYKNRDLMVEGSGFLQWLSVYALATSPAINVLLLDEPDAHLHTTLQHDMLENLGLLAERTGKQVLVATHSAELLRNSPPELILEVREGGRGSHYLTENHQKVGLLAGLGSSYAPRIDQVRRTKRLLFVEGNDCAVLRAFAAQLGTGWPAAWVEWHTTYSHRERRQLFLALQEEIPDLRCYSLRDRDDEPLDTVGPSLEDKGMAITPEFFPRKWRRRYIESYVVWPPALAAAAGRTQAAVEKILSDDFALAVSRPAFTRADAPAALLDVRAKAVLAKLWVAAVDVAKKMEPADIPDDIRTVLDELAREEA